MVYLTLCVAHCQLSFFVRANAISVGANALGNAFAHLRFTICDLRFAICDLRFEEFARVARRQVVCLAFHTRRNRLNELREDFIGTRVGIGGILPDNMIFYASSSNKSLAIMLVLR